MQNNFSREFLTCGNFKKEYFKTRSSAILRQCKQVEKEIDDEIERANKIVTEQQQPKLF